MNKPYSCLIIGLGQVGLTYDLDYQNLFLTHAKAVQSHKSFSLDAAVDVNREKRELFKKSYKAQVFKTLEEAASYKKYSVIIVSVPTESHYKIVMETLSYCKPKVILCEKPISYRLKEAEEIVKKCRKLKIKLFINYIRRSDQASLEIKSKIQSEQSSSTPLRGFGWYDRGLLHNGLHLVDLCNFWLGPVKQLTKISSLKKVSPNDYLGDFNVEFENGNVNFFSCDNKSFSLHSLELLTSKGRIRYDYEGNLAYFNGIKRNKFLNDFLELDKNNIIFKNNLDQCQLNVINEISNFLENKSYNLCSSEFAYDTFKKIVKMIES